LNESIVFSDKTLTKRIVFATREILCFVLNLKTGQTLPVHKHENSGLVYQVLSGSCEIKVNDEAAKVSAGEVGYVKGEDDFSIPAVNADLSLLVTISPNPSNEIYSKSFG
jgi:mannose-6-phosphate isomerase-like protein (cupin superfamily)